MNSLNLNHPWFIYPRGIMSEYNNYSHFRKESIKLYEFIDELPSQIIKNHQDKDILIPFIIGSAMEDALAKSNSGEENLFQFTQLFPNYVDNFIKCKNKKKFIQIIIISPDDIFKSEIKPYFTIYSSYDFISNSKNEYIYSDSELEIKINIFNCMVPCLELRNKIIEKYDTLIKNTNVKDNYNISSYKQTEHDLKFIDKFYLSIDRLFSLVLNPNLSLKIIINSWVSFKNLNGVAEKYNMFPKILELANKYNILATEWEFIEELFYAKIISQYKFYNKNFYGCNLNYAFNDELQLDDLPTHVIKSNFNLNNLFVIDFDFPYDLKKYLSAN